MCFFSQKFGEGGGGSSSYTFETQSGGRPEIIVYLRVAYGVVSRREE